MLPQLVVSKDKENVKKHVNVAAQENAISAYGIFEIQILEDKTEIIAEQIRAIAPLLKTAAATKRLVVIYDFQTAGSEAQNSFLKTLEEKNETTLFILHTENEMAALPTIRSRVSLVRLEDASAQEPAQFSAFFEEVTKLQPTEALAEKSVQKIDRAQAILFCTEALNFTRHKFRTQKTKATTIAREILKLLSLVQNNNVSPRLAIDTIILKLANTS